MYNIYYNKGIKFYTPLAIGHVNVQSCLLIIFQYQPISLQYSWQSVEQPIRFQLSVVYLLLESSNTKEDNSNVNTPWKVKLLWTERTASYNLFFRIRKHQWVYRLITYILYPNFGYMNSGMVWGEIIFSGCSAWAGPIYFPAVTIYLKWMCKTSEATSQAKIRVY